jgi:polyhydroxybutyrate depolymerase
VIRILVAIFVLLCATIPAAPSAAAEPGIPDGQTERAITSGGLERSYLVYKPADLPPSAPLVVILHGLSGTAEDASSMMGWNQLADGAKFAIAYPSGLSRSWNIGAGCCGQSGQQNVNDIGFIADVVRDVSANVSINPNRVYAAGISNGGGLAFALACNIDLFAAVAAVSATQLGDCAPTRPPSVIQINGTWDPIVHYDGGPSLGFGVFPSVPSVNAFWRNASRCDPPTEATDANLTISTAGCPNGRAVELVTVNDGGHAWPSFATSMIWEFFAAHPR